MWTRVLGWVGFLMVACAVGQAQLVGVKVSFAGEAGGFPLVTAKGAATLVVEAESPEVLRKAGAAFCGDVESVAGLRPRMVASVDMAGSDAVMVGVVGQSKMLDDLRRKGLIDTSKLAGQWETALVTVVRDPAPGVKRALVIAGSDRRGAAFALLGISKAMGVSPWAWWADVPVMRHAGVWVEAKAAVQPGPSVQYRGIFLNDEDWGLRPWAGKKMDPELKNIGPKTYARIFELLLRLRANTLWPAMHPGTMAFNAVPEDAKLADAWGIVMGSSHSEALLRNNVGEWSEKRDGPWNFQVNKSAIVAYWKKRVEENGGYENFYTVGMRGVHDSGLEATGTKEVKAALVEDVMREQQKLLKEREGEKAVPQVIWLYKESLDLYRVGMKVPEDVTLGFTDDNYGYIRQLPTVEEQKRKGGAGMYYHVSYWGAPHDYLWLCSTPVAQIREEMTKAYDHGVRKYWVLNVGDLKPAEMDLDYFMQLAWDEPGMAAVEQSEFLKRWFAEQFGTGQAAAMASVMGEYDALNFVRKPEFMGFNGYNDGVQRTKFNPLAWGDQNKERQETWEKLVERTHGIGARLSKEQAPAFFELEGYPVEAAAAQNEKFLEADRTYLDEAGLAKRVADAAASKAAYEHVQQLTATYNGMLGGKWSGMMSAAPRERHVFEMPVLADGAAALPASWGSAVGTCDLPPSGFGECWKAVSMNAAHYVRKSDGALAQWETLKDLGITGASMIYGRPGLLANDSRTEKDAWLEYAMTTQSEGETSLEVDVLPTFAVDPQHGLRFGVSVDGRDLGEVAASMKGAMWEKGVLENRVPVEVPMGMLKSGTHTVRLRYVDPGVVFEHVVVRFEGAAPGYPVPGETRE